MKKWESNICCDHSTLSPESMTIHVVLPEAYNERTAWIPPLNFWVLFGLDLWSVNLLDEHIVLSLILHSFDFWCVHLSSVMNIGNGQIVVIFIFLHFDTPMGFNIFQSFSMMATLGPISRVDILLIARLQYNR